MRASHLRLTATAALLLVSPVTIAATPAATSPAVPAALARTTAATRAATYTVRPGDTLARIAQRACGGNWAGLYHANRAVIGADPNRIRPGQRLTIACSRPPAPLTLTRAGRDGDGDGDHDTRDTAAPAPAPVRAGAYSFTALENLWISAGGSPGTAAHAACIAEHESGGRPWAISPTNDWGLWQIHAGGPAMLNPFANARRAIAMSGDGTNWSQWTTARFC